MKLKTDIDRNKNWVSATPQQVDKIASAKKVFCKCGYVIVIVVHGIAFMILSTGSIIFVGSELFGVGVAGCCGPNLGLDLVHTPGIAGVVLGSKVIDRNTVWSAIVEQLMDRNTCATIVMDRNNSCQRAPANINLR